MDWNAAIEHNRQALKRILAALVGMAGLAGAAHPEVLANGEPRTTIPRHLRNAILRLLRPAESAARRLIVASARGHVVALPPQRPRKPAPSPKILRNGVGTGIVWPRGMKPGTPRDQPQAIALPLLDPPRRILSLSKGSVRPRSVPAHLAPRISAPGATRPARLPPPPSPDDRIDATRLTLRFDALARALDDGPKQALRFARWQARQARRRQGGSQAATLLRQGSKAGFRWPLRAGRPPGACRRSGHEVHEILNNAHGLAHFALAQPDTS